MVPRPGAAPQGRDIVQHVKGFVDRGVLPKEAVLLRARLVEGIARTSVGKANKVAMREMYLKDIED